MMAAVGIRELKANLSRYLRHVAGGATVRVTQHGRTIATIQPVAAAADVTWANQLVAEGRAKWSGGKPAGAGRPVRLKGGAKPTSAMVIEDRR
jgi:prevent-host-death family protein